MSTIKVDTINTRTGSGNITFSRPTVLTAGDIVTADIANDAITTVKVADDAVTIAKLAATGTASSSTFLRGDNAWAEAGGGAWNLIGTAVASNSTSLTITGLDNTYDSYAIQASELAFSSSGEIGMKVGTSGGGIVTTSYDGSYSTTNSTTFTGWNVGGGNGWYLGNGDTGSATASSMSFSITMYRNRLKWGPLFSGSIVYRKNSYTIQGGQFSGGNRIVPGTAIDRVELSITSGNFTSGRFSIYGIAHA